MRPFRTPQTAVYQDYGTIKASGEPAGEGESNIACVVNEETNPKMAPDVPSQHLPLAFQELQGSQVKEEGTGTQSSPPAMESFANGPVLLASPVGSLESVAVEPTTETIATKEASTQVISVLHRKKKANGKAIF